MILKELTSDLLFFSVLIVFVASTVFQLAYYWGVFSRLAFLRRKSLHNQYRPVSVIICARNEFLNLKKNLKYFLEQDYPDYEVVVVNDCSDDESGYLLKAFADHYPNLKVITVHQNVNFFSGKKFALAVGIKSATHELLLLTDADCMPGSNRWIAEMQNNFVEGKSIVLGYSGYEKKPGMLNKLIRYETVTTAMQYLSWAMAGNPYMGVGRNLAYNKELFLRSKGFTKHYHIASGDDDLFINAVATAKNTTIEIRKSAQTTSPPKQTFSDWFNQKKRHFSTGVYYKRKHQFILGFYSLTNTLFYAALVTLLIILGLKPSPYSLIIIAAAFTLKTVSQVIILKNVMKKLDEKNLLLISPLLDFVFVILNPLIAISNLLKKQTTWK